MSYTTRVLMWFSIAFALIANACSPVSGGVVLTKSEYDALQAKASVADAATSGALAAEQSKQATAPAQTNPTVQPKQLTPQERALLDRPVMPRPDAVPPANLVPQPVAIQPNPFPTANPAVCSIPAAVFKTAYLGEYGQAKNCGDNCYQFTPWTSPDTEAFITLKIDGSWVIICENGSPLVATVVLPKPDGTKALGAMSVAPNRDKNLYLMLGPGTHDVEIFFMRSITTANPSTGIPVTAFIATKKGSTIVNMNSWKKRQSIVATGPRPL